MTTMATKEPGIRANARLLAVGLLGLVIGFALRGCFLSTPPSGDAVKMQATGERAEVWTCSMHPQIRQPKPGKCPICAMDLIPVNGGGEEKTGPSELVMSPSARKLAEIRLAPVERRFVEVAVRMAGKVQLDETRVAHIAPRVSGRIDRLYVNFIGVPVKRGDHLADFYSPELVSAQQELIQAGKAVRGFGDGGAVAGLDSARAMLDSAREKLRLWQLTPEQIADIERSGKPRDHLTFYSPLAGVVVERMDTFEGMYVETGMKLFTVADLSRVWIKLDAYESDLVWLRYGQPVTVQVEAYPGETFSGTIAFIDPVLDPMTRTVKIRVNAENGGGRLKPEMFVHAVVAVRSTETGKVIQPNLAGKWISPMHPEIVKDDPGTCDVCGMPLVPAEELGYATNEPNRAEAPLVIPASAPLITGERAVVYVAVPGKEGVFEGREIVLGPKARDFYLVRSGLKEGDLVVVNGGFKIDSSLQIQGRTSMMQPQEEVASGRSQMAGKKTEEAATQTRCPVMGGAINRDLYADYEGQRVYFCCPGCKEPFLKEPKKYLEQMRAEGIRPETAPGETGKPVTSPHAGHAQ
jgi:Cu(I)/Ag(I) efflux system membrane fusion protein